MRLFCKTSESDHLSKADSGCLGRSVQHFFLNEALPDHVTRCPRKTPRILLRRQSPYSAVNGRGLTDNVS